jgi:hypothetical protein
MRLALPLLELAPGNIFCLHIPHGCHEAAEALEDEILELASRQGKAAIISRPAGFGARAGESFANQSSEDWLSHAATISKQQSAEWISSLGVRVAEKIAFNAGTPRCLMGLVAALMCNPDVIVYSTCGLDSEGHRSVHGFVDSRCGPLCAIHVSYPSQFGDGSPHPRLCPARARCIELAE